MREPRSPDRSNGAPPAGAHPDVDAWIAYHEGDLATAEQDRLRAHLVECPACVATLLELDAFVAGDREELSEFERAAAWRAMRAAIERDEARDGARDGSATAARHGARWRFAVAGAVAASLVAGVLGIGLWNAQRNADELRATVATLVRPQINVPIRDLFPDTATRSGGDTRPAEVPPAEFFTLVLNLEEPREFAGYEVEILDPAGDLVWSSRGLEMSPFGTFTLGLSRRFLAAGGEHRVRLYGVEAGSKELLQDYALRVR